MAPPLLASLLMGDNSRSGQDCAPSVLVLALEANVFEPFESELGRRCASVTRWTRIPRDIRLVTLTPAEVVVVACRGDLDSDLMALDQIRESCPTVEVVCICSRVTVDTAVSTLRRGVFAIVPSNATSDDLLRVVEAAADRRRRGDRRLELLRSGAR